MRLHSLWLLLIILIFFTKITFAQNTIMPNEPIEGILSENNITEEYTFIGQAGDVVTITLSSRLFDSYLVLENLEGVEIASNDDFGGSLDATIENLTLSESGTYIIIVGSADGAGTGAYELNLTYRSIQPIEYGDVLQAEITEDNLRITYRFEGQAGDTLFISMTSTEFDTFLHLSNGEYDLISDDDGGDGTNSLISGYTLPETGTYFIITRGYSPLSLGTYTLQVYPVEITPLAANTTIEADIQSDVLMYSFEASVGDIIDIDIDGYDGLDTALILNAPRNYVLFTDDDSGNDLNPEIHNWLIEESGTYTLIIHPVDRNAVGRYALTFTLQAPQAISCDLPQNLQFSPKNQHTVFSFDIQANDDFNLVFTSGAAQLDTLSVRTFNNGEFLSTEITNDNNALIIAATAPSDGIMRVLVTNFSNHTQQFTVELTCP